MVAEPARQVVIKNPVLNSPYEEPHRHFKFDDDGSIDSSPLAVIHNC
jgi:hypothetical protein